VGALLTAGGCGRLLQAFAQFVVEGVGTPAPPAPTRQLVTRGLCRYERNPLYLAVLAGIAGQAVLLDRPVLLMYAAAVAAAAAACVRRYEEPTLARRYGAQYQEYCRQVPRWLPARPGRR
jgi:protein-S-isoprenylcysteine O-methyltransferase Ste14